MILRREWTLRHGKPYKFRTQPVDPYDAFRGRYVALSLEPDAVAVATNQTFEYGTRLYAALEEGPDGFVRVSAVSSAPPVGKDYVKAKALWRDKDKLRVQWPFDRFYMEETKAPAAERAYREHSRRGQQNAYVIVRVRHGMGVIENLFVGDKPMTEFLRAELKPK
jgi:uncharacterized membrane-anchored protein